MVKNEIFLILNCKAVKTLIYSELQVKSKPRMSQEPITSIIVYKI